MSASSNQIEPPKMITCKNEGVRVMAEVCSLLASMRNETRPLCGLLYLKFNTEPELDEWIATFKTVTNKFWRQRMNKADDLYFFCVSRQDDRTTLDVFFAETEENVKMIAKMRFPEMDF